MADQNASPATPAETEKDPDLRERWQRALADVENTRKWADRNAAEQRMSERFAVSAAWLPVLDHLDIALQHAEADPRTIITGVEQVRQQAQRVLALLGFEPIAAVGEPFDPQRHEAAEVVRDGDAPPGTVVRVLRPGYAKGVRLLRPAVVAVSAPPEPSTARDGGPDGG